MGFSTAVYMDYNATAPLRADAQAAMVDVITSVAGNASSVHAPGRAAHRALDLARTRVAAAIGGDPKGVVFTSSATEANNLALKGWALGGDVGQRRSVVTTMTEHPSVLAPLRWLKSRGHLSGLLYLAVDAHGRMSADDLREIVGSMDAPLLVSIIAANNETGVVAPIRQLAEVAREAGAVVHVDATQALGRVLVDVEAWGVDLLTLSSHKLGGPGGAGALWVREGVSMAPLHHGGHQERNRRGGTENVASLVGFGAACETITRNGLEEMQRVEGLRDGLFQAMLAAIPDVVRVGAPESCLGNTLSVAFPGAEGEALLMGLDLAGVAVSSGSACTAGSLEPSHVLSAMGLAEATARAVVRFSLGHGNVPEDVGVVMDVLPTVVARARKERA